MKLIYTLSRLINKEFLLSCIRIFVWGLVYYFVAWFSLEYLIDASGVAIAWIMLRFVANPFAFTKIRNFLLYLLYSVVLCQGFDTSCKEAKTGMGLMNIQQRIRILGGNFKIESDIGKGCTIFVDFPMKEANNRIEVHTLQDLI